MFSPEERAAKRLSDLKQSKELLAHFADVSRRSRPEPPSVAPGAGLQLGDAAWVPLPEFQRLRVPGQAGGPGAAQFYDLCFPLELTNRDYMRRVLDLVAQARERHAGAHFQPSLRPPRAVVVLLSLCSAALALPACRV